MVENRHRLWIIESLKNPKDPAARPLSALFPGTIAEAVEYAGVMANLWHYHRPKVRLAQPRDIFNAVNK